MLIKIEEVGFFKLEIEKAIVVETYIELLNNMLTELLTTEQDIEVGNYFNPMHITSDDSVEILISPKSITRMSPLKIGISTSRLTV